MLSGSQAADFTNDMVWCWIVSPPPPIPSDVCAPEGKATEPATCNRPEYSAWLYDTKWVPTENSEYLTSELPHLQTDWKLLGFIEIGHTTVHITVIADFNKTIKTFNSDIQLYSGIRMTLIFYLKAFIAETVADREAMDLFRHTTELASSVSSISAIISNPVYYIILIGFVIVRLMVCYWYFCSCAKSKNIIATKNLFFKYQ